MHVAPHQTLGRLVSRLPRRQHSRQAGPAACTTRSLVSRAFGLPPARLPRAWSLALPRRVDLPALPAAHRMPHEVGASPLLVVARSVIVFPGSGLHTGLWPHGLRQALPHRWGGYVGAVPDRDSRRLKRKRGRAAGSVALWHALTVVNLRRADPHLRDRDPADRESRACSSWLRVAQPAALIRAGRLARAGGAGGWWRWRLLVRGECSSASGFNTHRSVAGLISHYGPHPLRPPGRTWHQLPSLPGTLGGGAGFWPALRWVGGLWAAAQPEARVGDRTPACGSPTTWRGG